jgi:hypothetical protein
MKVYIDSVSTLIEYEEVFYHFPHSIFGGVEFLYKKFCANIEEHGEPSLYYGIRGFNTEGFQEISLEDSKMRLITL